MSAYSNFKLAIQLYKQDKNAHLGDIAVLKTDIFGADVRPALRPLLEPVRGWVPEIDLKQLAAMAEGSFGRALADFMMAHQLSPFRLTSALTDEVRRRNAFGIRYATTHDMFHVLLGFDTTWAGEIGVLGFAIGQNYSRFQQVGAWLAWLLYPVLSGFRVRSLWRAWRHGRRVGKQAPFLLGVRLEERFDTPLAALRRELNIEAF